MSRADQQSIAKYFKKKPVLYIGGLGQVFSMPAGILLSQLLYWHGQGGRKDGYIYKTADEIRSELGMSRTSQETAIKQLRECGVIDYKLAQVPARRHFRVNLQRLHELLPSLKETSKLIYPNPANYYVTNSQSITKITRENTLKNTPIGDKKSFFEARAALTRKMGKPP